MLTTLYGKLAAVLLGLLVLSGGLYTGLTLWTTRLYFQEVTQKLNRTLAHNLVAESLPLRDGSIDAKALHDIFHILMVINPNIEVYVLDTQGRVLAYSAPAGKVLRQEVAMAPLQRFLQGRDTLPILGDDPRHASRQKIFSVAPIPPQGPVEGYLYVVLAGEEYDSVAQVVQGSYILRVSAWATAAGVVFVIGAGLLLFHRLTRRLRRLTVAMEEFQHSQQDAAATVVRPLPGGGDDIDRLGLAFRSMAARIRQQMRRLQHTDALRRELIANVSHDLRTPLAALHGYLETLLLKGDQLDTAEHQQYLATAARHSRRLGKLVSELFELAKLEAQGMQIHPEAFALPELLQDVAQKFQLMAHQKQQTLHVQCAEDLPFVAADIGLIERVLDNLIHNALHYTAPGGTITLALTLDRQDVRVQVMDTGNGIAPEDLPHIFERFYRARDHRQETTGGVGLGLAIAKRIVELHSRSITAHRRSRGGTMFTFQLPTAQG